MRSIQAEQGRGEVTITNPVEYAAIHNEGGTVETSPTVTPKMRKMAWRKCYALAGVKGKGKLPKELPEEAEKWRALALTKKSRLHIKANIPQRQFIGESKELTDMHFCSAPFAHIGCYGLRFGAFLFFFQ